MGAETREALRGPVWETIPECPFIEPPIFSLVESPPLANTHMHHLKWPNTIPICSYVAYS